MIEFQDGVYFGLSDEEYHADTALGSTSLKKLISNAPDFWWSSHFNPDCEPKDDTPALIFGRQLHTCVLEGREKFESLYAPKMIDNWATKEGRAEKAEIEASGKQPIALKDWRRILLSSAFIKANKYLKEAFEDGEPEVTVFWTTQDGIRLKARIDYLKYGASVDLKSIKNNGNKRFDAACKKQIADYDYIVSIAHYNEGRKQMRRLISQGLIFGRDSDGWLHDVTENEEYAFVLVFWQKEHAPISCGLTISQGNPLLGYAENMISLALDNYKNYMRVFGKNAAWIPSQELQELDESDLPAYYKKRLNYGE